MVIGLPNNLDILLQYEKVFNGYTSKHELETTKYEKSRHVSNKLTPCPLSEENDYTLEPHDNFLIDRSINLTKDYVSNRLEENKLILIQKNTPKDLQQKFVVMDEDHHDYKNIWEDYGKDTINIPLRCLIDTAVEKTIPAVVDGEHPKEKTPDQIHHEVAAKFKLQLNKIISAEQKVLDKLIEENIEIVKAEVEEEKHKGEQNEHEQKTKDAVVEEKPLSNANDDKEVDKEENEQHKVDEEESKVGLYEKLIQTLYTTWKSNEKEYAQNMIKFFKSVRKQHANIDSGLDDIKNGFKAFLDKLDEKQEKLDHFIESFNKFTEEFPELRPDEQTKEELNNRCDMLNDEFWDIIERNKDDAINERKRIMESGWIEHEIQQLTLKAQQFISFEIKRCTSSLNFIRDYLYSKKGEGSLDECEIINLTIHNNTNSESEMEGQIEQNNEEELFNQSLAIVAELDALIEKQDSSDLELLEAFRKERSILLYRIWAIRNWTMNGLKDIKTKINEVYDILDDWVVDNTVYQNKIVNETVNNIRDIIDSNDPIDSDFKLANIDEDEEGEDNVQFIETVVDRSFIEGKAKMKFSYSQAKEFYDIFKKFSKDQFIDGNKAREIIVVIIKLNPDLVPAKWRTFPLSHIDELVNMHIDEESGYLNWRNFVTYCVLTEAFIPMVDRASVTNAYRKSLKKSLEEEYEEYIDLENFLQVKCWYDAYLAMRRKEDVQFEEDKEEIDQEIAQVKELLYHLNASENGKLHIDQYIETLLKLWPKA